MILAGAAPAKNTRDVTENKIMRPIFWGLIFFGIGAVGWVVSVVLTVVSLGALKPLTYVFGILFLASLPVAAVLELIRKLKNKNASKIQSNK